MNDTTVKFEIWDTAGQERFQSLTNSYYHFSIGYLLVFDLSDDISYKGRRNFTLIHFTERINIYNEQQFKYEISKVNLSWMNLHVKL